MSRRFTRRSSGCAAPAPRRRPSRAGASATRRAPWTAISCRCCRRSPRPTMPPGARGRRNDRVPRRSERATVSAFSELDREAMQRALTLAERSEEHTSELQSQSNLVCRLLLEKKKIHLCLAVTRRDPDPCYPIPQIDRTYSRLWKLVVPSCLQLN